jgi:ATP-dependent Lhr-like helicase
MVAPALSARGASFYREILAAVLRVAVDRGERQPSERDLLDAIWDLVWATELTNDTFAPLRALRWPRNGRDRRAAAPRLGATGRMGPPEAAGRWSLVSEAIATSTSNASPAARMASTRATISSSTRASSMASSGISTLCSVARARARASMSEAAARTR